ncbi:mediator of RNA polymerase II transcription subunit 18-like [Haliotis cracherodii]|uniref:mediator of RNA polymerase II transcription subunit 18-like n=1 Tax=Haliotis rufescens TaxID=6454 RepID=UPI001EAFB5E7|nr:mediator of RNA polymerase II transcription subunit 18-like [Haliotis rufescens]
MESTYNLGMKYHITPQQEFLLQGSISDNYREMLLHRLRGLCDNAETTPETFLDHELVFALKGSAQPSSQLVLFRVRRSLDHTDTPWYIRYCGQTEIGDKTRPTLVRACFDVACSENVVQFLNEMGFRLDHEYVVRGCFFHKGRMKVTVSKLYRMLQSGNTENNSLEPLSQSQLVELSVIAPAGQEQIGEDMKNFSEQLKPLVHLEKIDHRMLAKTPQ